MRFTPKKHEWHIMMKRLFENIEHVPPGMLKKMLSQCLWEGSPESGALALTFDDGPDPEMTPRVLDVLDEISARATFFMLGSAAKKHPSVARMVHERGHLIGNHSMNHQRLFLLKRDDIEHEIDDAGKAISDAAGVSPILFRPPYGMFGWSCARIVRKRGLEMVLWTVLSGDYSENPPDYVLKMVSPFVRPGAIIICHDKIGSARGCLVDVLRRIGTSAAGKGLCLGTIEEIRIKKFSGTGESVNP